MDDSGGNVDPWSGVEIYWEYQGNKLTVGMSGPAFLLKRFLSPTEVMVSFMQAIAASDNSLMIERMESIHTRFTPTGFSATWVGTVVDTEGRLPMTMNNMTRAIGGNEL